MISKSTNKKLFGWAHSDTPSQRRGLRCSDDGFAALYIAILILAVIFTIGVSLSVLTYSQQKKIKNITNSSRAYYTAEAGVEDAVLRLTKKLNWSSPYFLKIADSTTTIIISDIIGGARTITASGDTANRIRKVAATYEISTDEISFFYGAQVGDGGIEMDDLSVIDGNVFSNGSIIAESSNSQITGTAKVAKNGNKIQKATILEDAYVDICENARISGTLYFNTNHGCTASNFITLGQEIAPLSLPISQEKINEWKQEAVAGGTINSDYELSSGTIYLGPKKIQGNLTIENNAQFFITGTLWVTGNVNIENNAVVKLDSASYGALSGMIVADGTVVLENNSISSGTGQAGSYLMYLSTSPSESAILVKNNAQADILFTLQGWIEIKNNSQLREITGYGIKLKNNARITYEVGLEDTSFSSGPGGSWEVNNWKEIE